MSIFILCIMQDQKSTSANSQSNMLPRGKMLVALARKRGPDAGKTSAIQDVKSSDHTQISGEKQKATIELHGPRSSTPYSLHSLMPSPNLSLFPHSPEPGTRLQLGGTVQGLPTSTLQQPDTALSQLPGQKGSARVTTRFANPVI